MDKGSLIKLAREGKTMSCTCSLKPANLKIIRVGESEVGFIGLEKSFRQVYFLKIEDEVKLREKIMEKIKENNFIPPEREVSYGEALLREYHSYVERRFGAKKVWPQPRKQTSRWFLQFLRKFGRDKGGRK
ncbi:MAG: hypothetical protein ACUVR0_08420 [Candidatus Aminicenantales bacterium]